MLAAFGVGGHFQSVAGADVHFTVGAYAPLLVAESHVHVADADIGISYTEEEFKLGAHAQLREYLA